MKDNLETYVNGKINAGARRVLITKWVGQAWEQLSTDKAMIVRSFKKAGTAVAIDGSEDNEIHIEGLPAYKVEDSEDEEYTSEDEDEDPFAGCSDDSDN